MFSKRDRTFPQSHLHTLIFYCSKLPDYAIKNFNSLLDMDVHLFASNPPPRDGLTAR
ncbi:hypothetical protein [Nostoc sp. C110]|uniref:hypothetical protein n=1 Tax=Nostoc sp. C110 TaxID=3349876 RepID=UPI00370D5C94